MSSLKKNPVENYMAPDPANFLHQLPQKESSESYLAPDPANFQKIKRIQTKFGIS
jgi:hypothetical protein